MFKRFRLDRSGSEPAAGRTITIHVGMPKTGSTTIQRFLYANRDTLGTLGIALLDCFQQPNNVGLAFYARDKSRSGSSDRRSTTYGQQGLGSRAEVERYRKEVRAKLAAEIEALPVSAHSILLSSELCARFDLKAMRRLRALFRPYAAEIRIVICLRRQLDLLHSAYSTSLRNGFAGTFAEHVERDAGADYLDYDRKLALWARVFGRDRVSVALYRNDLWPDGDLVHEFCDKAGIPYRQSFVRPDSANKSLDHRVQGFLEQVNRIYPTEPSQGDFAGWRFLTSALARGDYSGLPRRETAPVPKTIVARFERSNERVRRRWFPDLPALFPAEGDGRAAEAARDPGAQVVAALMVDAIERALDRRDVLDQRIDQARQG